ncbi:MAG: hypothetical protein KatS3mg057_0428 [Herpetosiphonaceae bacterium]|nr:MAG: hypothetical protein KatS3mg057_0428 [Herpetosiphonaceae bacterium]
MPYRSLVLVLLALALSGCGGSQAPTATQPLAALSPTADRAAAPTAVPTSPPSTPTAAAKEVIDSSDVVQAPEGLNSYRSRLEIRLKGAQGATPIDGRLIAAQERVKDPPAQRMALASEGQLGDIGGAQTGDFELIQIGDQAWLKVDGQWISSSGVDPAQFDTGLMSPADLLADLRSARLVSSGELVSGVQTNHYHFSKDDLAPGSALASADEVSGDLWLSAEGGYVVQMTMTATGGHVLGEGGQNPFTGTVEFFYLLSDLNAPVVIEPPKGG